MKFLSKNIKKISLTGFLSVFLMFFSTHFANAVFFDSIASGVIGFVLSFGAYVLGFIAGVLFQIIGYLVTLALNVNLLITSPTNVVVRSGWDIILNITNLGFVLAIIVIAFATILRFENYAIKKTLWKLIVAALLVNFSLTISGAFIDVANNATQFMMKKSGVSGDISMNTLKGSAQWATAIGGMFQVQQYLQVKKVTDSLGGTNTALDSVKGVINGSIGSFVTLIASLIFIAVFVFIASITFFTVGILLFIRYVQLSFLLMFSPIIWLAWIFPATQNYWQMWWKRFIKWTLFAPIMMFFMYLSLRAMSGVASMTKVPSNISNPVTFGLESVGQMALVIGLMMGGMFVANAMGIEGANVVYGAASKYGKGWAYRGGQRAINAKVKVPFVGTGSINDLTTRLSNTRGLKWAGRGLNYLGAGVEKGAAGAMGDYRNYVKGLSKERLENEILSTGTLISGRNKNIAVEEAIKNKKLTDKVVSELLMNPDKLEAMEKSFKAQNLDFGDVTKAIGTNVKILKLSKEISNTNLDDLLKQMKELEEDGDIYGALALTKTDTYQKLKSITDEQNKFFEKMSPDDIGKSSLAKELYKNEPVFKNTLGDSPTNILQRTFIESLIESNRFGSVYKILPNLKGEEIENINNYVKSTVEKLKNTGNEAEKKKAENIEFAFNKAMHKRLYGEPPEDKKKEEKKDDSGGGDKKGGDKK